MAKRVILEDNSGNKCYPITRDVCVLSRGKTLSEEMSILMNFGLASSFGTSLDKKAFLTTGGGVSPEDDNWVCNSEYISCNPGDVFIVRLKGGNPGMNVFSAYSKKLEYISGSSVKGDSWDELLEEFTIPEGVYNCKFCSDSSFPFYVFPKSENIKALINAIENKALKNEEILNSLFKYTDLDFKRIGYIQTNGAFAAGDKNWISSEKIEVNPGDLFLINIIGQRGNQTGVNTISYYDSSDSFIPEVSETNKTYNDYVLVVPGDERIKKICFSGKSAEFGSYSPYIKKIDISSSADAKIQELEEKITEIENKVNIAEEANILNGYLTPQGNIGSSSDINWIRTDFIPTSQVKEVKLTLKGTYQIGTICYYDNEKTFMPDISIAGVDKEYVEEIVKINQEASFFKICGKSDKFGSYKHEILLLNDIASTVESLAEVSYKKQDIGFIYPSTIYSVCNDIGENKPYDRNISPCLYLDHFFDGISQELNIRFKDNNDVRLPFDFALTTGAGWDSELNNNSGVNIVEKDIILNGKEFVEKKFKIKVITTLASSSKTKKAFVLCIGDSITWGEGATDCAKGTLSSRKPYHCLCTELFKKDNVDADGGYEVVMIGSQYIKGTFRYKEQDYSYTSCHDGVRGIAINGVINNSSAFKDSNGKFSINAWLARYRTLSDDGVRLEVGSGTGTEINSGNINNINCCTPTHIVIALGTNGGATLEQYNELISLIRKELPDVNIAIAMPDSAGTIFPSVYRCSPRQLRWNADSYIDVRHTLQYKCQKIIMDNFDSEQKRNEKIYALPFFFTHHPLSYSSRNSNFPDYEYKTESIHNEPYGWLPATHVDISAHANWAYQLYAWIKYTLTKDAA